LGSANPNKAYGHALIARNTIFLFASKMVGFAAFFLFMIVAANQLGKDRFGALSVAIGYTSMFLILSDLGLSLLVVREIGRNRDTLRDYYSNGSILKIVLSFATLAAAVVLLPLCNYRSETTILIPLILLGMLAFSHTQFLGGLFRGIERMEYEAVMFLIERGVILSAGLVCLYHGGGLMAVGLVFLAARILSLLAGLLSIRRYTGSLRLRYNKGFIRKMIVDAYPFAPFAFLATAYFQIDVFILSLLRAEEEVGLFRAALQLVVVWYIIIEAYSGALLPVLSRAYLDSRENIVPLCRRGLRYMTLAGLPLSIGICILAKEIMTVYKEEFHTAWVALAISAWTILFRLLSGIPSTLLTAVDLQSQRFYVVLIGCILSVVLNVVLISYLGFLGCAISTVATSLFLLIAYWYLAYRAGFAITPDSRTIRACLAGVLMALPVWFCSRFGLYIQVGIGFTVYAAAVLGLGAVDRRELSQVVRIFWKKNP
jgi:O-antigen/teichoic acid export membrane protein